MRLRTLIADDEPLARERLRLLLAHDAEIDVSGECRSGREVIAALKASEIDVLFLDIQMPGVGGFEIFEEMGPARMPVTVFVTAHHHYAVQAFQVEALDYLTKPVEPERMQATLLRVKERIASQAALMSQEQFGIELASLQASDARQKEYRRRMLVRNGSKEHIVIVNEIDWIEAADYYCCLHIGKKTLMLRETIKHLAETLDPNRFVRIHRSTIVNVEQVREIVREGQSEGFVTLIEGQRLRMSKLGWQSLLAVSRV
jgi:two-component system LytT family response regulator